MIFCVNLQDRYIQESLGLDSILKLITRYICAVVVSLSCVAAAYAQSNPRRPLSGGNNSETSHTQEKSIEPQVYSWGVSGPMGLREPAVVDTNYINYSMQSIPSAVSPAYATTGNLGGPGMNLIFTDRAPMSDFFFKDALEAWLPSRSKMRFYNSRIPLTFLSYNFGGGRYNSQDRLKAAFSGNVNKRLQFGAITDYLYSKGSYDNQAAKCFTWGFSTSYIGDRFDIQAYHYHYNLLNQENGGITDDMYITDPAEMQGGNAGVNPKNIPTNLNRASNRNKGTDIYVNGRYKLGFWRDITTDEDTVERLEFVPVTAIVYTFNWTEGKHRFRNTNATQDQTFWENCYLSNDGTQDFTTYSSVSNTVGLSLLEGFNKYAKFGLSAYATFDLRSYKQTADSALFLEDRTGLTEYDGPIPVEKKKDGRLTIGAQLSKQQGSILRYEATGELGVSGRTTGDVLLDGHVDTRIPLGQDSLDVRVRGRFTNSKPSYFVENYISNHFIWEKDFGKIRRVKVGGEVAFPKTRTRVSADVENIQNYVYFNDKCLPAQHGGNIQVLTLQLSQDLAYRALHWNNRVIWQKCSDSSVIPMPSLAVNSNLYVLFKIARVLDVQFGVDCDFYTKYKAYDYQPATMTFYTQNETECGGFPFMNAYLNMKLGRTRFYVMMSHVNQGLFGKPDYFSMPHYPLNPRRFQLGLSIEFRN